MNKFGVFPFGQPVNRVEQTDHAPKRCFVLGVYASAVHAKWIGADSKVAVKALAVASEPYIFWRGENADFVISKINIPETMGHLVPADHRFNGPSGIALDYHFLSPLGLDRANTWLCDLVPHSCMNDSQRQAIDRAYLPLIEQNKLPVPTVPPVPNQLANDMRRQSILEELEDSQARILILLGDQPIKWFLAHFDNHYKRLSDFGQGIDSYGKLHAVELEDIRLQVLPLAHPRQVAKLGTSSTHWFELHRSWCDSVAPTLI